MKKSTNRILTSHVGSLSRPADLIEMYREQAPPEKLESRLTSAVAEVVRKQTEAGIDVVNDGEFGKPVSDEVDYGAWATYIYQRVSGFEWLEAAAGAAAWGSNLGYGTLGLAARSACAPSQRGDRGEGVSTFRARSLPLRAQI